MLGLASACKKMEEAHGEVTRNWTPAQQGAYLGVPAADVHAAIATRLGGRPPAPLTKDQWTHVARLYGTFNQTLLWLDDQGVHQPRVKALLLALAGADSDALRLDHYPLAELSQALQSIDGKNPAAQQLADADVLLSSAFVVFGEDLLTGQEKPSSFAQAWHINPMEERIDSALVLTLREDDLAGGLERMRPEDPGYDSLRVQLARYREIVANGGWPAVPDGDGNSPARVRALRARLGAEGYAVDSTRGAGVYDKRLAAAVHEFQTLHAIGEDGVLGPETIEALNLPAEYRAAQIAANLERYRWLPRSLGTRYILVNVPAFKLTAFDSGEKVLQMKVIVGKDYEDKATPVFSDSMEFVVFRPYWNVTPDIAAKEIFPKGPGYLAANDMEVYNDHGREAVRQRPGPKNALGFVKFMFPNDYNIYLHDTPNHELFSKDVRAFSHGCIRVENPSDLAQWVLGWPADRVDAAMHGADNHHVNLPRKVPVYIVYFTTFVDDGQLHFGNDLYDRDSKLVQELESAALPTDETREAQRALRALAGADSSGTTSG
ncbi:MAG: L,D-transpeptidase family protein [Gemmatimonadaceae bacterium]